MGYHYADVQRFMYYYRLFSLIHDVEGDVVECGVYKGATLRWLSIFVKDEMCGRKIWGFDSFEGFPTPTDADSSARKLKAGELDNTSIQAVTRLLLDSGFDRNFVTSQVTLIPGYFQDSLSKYRGDGIAFLNLDVDLYESYRTCLEQLYPRVLPGGIVVFDEYLTTKEYHKFPGAQRAIDEYLGDQVSLIKRDRATGKYYLIKPRV